MRILLLSFLLIAGFSNTSLALTYIVSSTADAGAGTLREAITLANGNAGADIISFSGLGAGIQTITLASDLPSPTEPVTIDGYTAPGYAANAPAIVLDGFTWGILFNNAVATGSIVRGIIFISATSGIEINGVNGISIQGCWFGINSAGAIPGGAPANRISFSGIYLVNSDNNIIGGTAAADRNILSGCDFEGIFLSAGSDNNQVYGNYIGVGTGGNTDVGNGQRGVRIENSNNNLIGNGTNTRNIISGNDNHGVLVLNSTGNLIASNYIGIGANGTTAIGNTIHGIIANASPTTIVGGITAAYRNVIGSNGGSGVSFENVSNFSSVVGNFIGTDATGVLARANTVHGVNINNSTDCLVQGNLISGNLISGVNVTLASHRTTIKTNIIGLNLANAGLGNGQHGIYLDASNSCVLGGTAWTDRNYCSSNGNAAGENGISILNCNNHVIKNNFCGLDLTGKLDRGNFDTGMSLTNSTGNTIGGATMAERNVCSGNPNFGMFFSNVDNSTIQGNYFGTDSTGMVALPNDAHGVQTQDACDLNTWQSNLASGNGQIGLNILSSTNNTFYGNLIGVGINGLTDLGNGSIGMRLGNTGTASTGNTIGGTTASQRNIISGNGDHGLLLDGASSNNIVKGNYVGSDITGLIAVPNQKSGIFTLDASNNNTIGGTLAGEGNLTCCSIAEVGIRSQVSSSNVYYGNIVGLNINKAISTGFGNTAEGMLFGAYGGQFANSNIIGGLGAGQANTISQNGSDGVLIVDYGPSAGGINLNPIIGNKIYCNGGLGINLNANIATENQGIAAPVITFRDGNTISGTGTTGNTIHVYRNAYNDGSGKCDCEGEIYVGTTTVSGGTWSLTHGLGLATAALYNAVTATQTNATNSTSEFASCTVPLPVILLNFEGMVNADGDAVLSWASSIETDFSHYTVMKSEDGILFYELEIVPAKGSGNSYQYVDALFDGTAYYKLALVDKDAKVKFSSVIKVGNLTEIVMLPNPASTEVFLHGLSADASVNVLNAVGVCVLGNAGQNFSVSALAPGVYIVQVNSENSTQNLKLIVE